MISVTHGGIRGEGNENEGGGNMERKARMEGEAVV